MAEVERLSAQLAAVTKELEDMKAAEEARLKAEEEERIRLEQEAAAKKGKKKK